MFNLCFSSIHRGTQFQFENGYIVSVQWGPANYCQNYNPYIEHFNDTDYRASPDAEIAVLDSIGNFVPPERYGFPDEMDDVVAHVAPDRVVDVMAFVKAW
jgi:hypothetical protein